MLPWTIIGWLILTALAVVFVVIPVGLGVWVYFRHLRTRDTPPAVGQVWLSWGRPLYIERLSSKGNVSICTENPAYCRNGGWTYATWSEPPETWKNRVRNRLMYLSPEPWKK